MRGLDFPTTASAIGRFFGGSVIGDGEAPVRSLAPLQSAGEGSLCFFSNRRYGIDLERAKGAVVLTSASLVRSELPITYVLVDDPQTAFARLARQFSVTVPSDGVSSHAIVHSGAILGEGVSVGPFAVVCEGARVGARTRLGAYVYVGAGVSLGEDCEVFPRVTILDDVSIGKRVRIFPGVVIGAEGFGLFEGPGGQCEMPQIGTVVVEDDVRIGANSTIDRSTLGATRVGAGTKMDDHVHIGHNAQVGKGCVLCGAVALGGSVVLEDGVILAGQVGVGHGVTIGAGARLGGQCGTTTNLKGGETYSLMPATPVREVARIVRYWRRLPEIWRRLRRIENQLGIDPGKGET